MALLLQRTDPQCLRIDLDRITPDVLGGLSIAQVQRLEVFAGNRRVALAEVFSVSGDASDGVVRLEGDCTQLDGIGAGMSGCATFKLFAPQDARFLGATAPGRGS